MTILLDLIYEAALVPELWPAVLDKIATCSGGIGTFLITGDAPDFRFARSSVLRDLGMAIVEGGWHQHNTRLQRLMQHRHAGFVRDVDIWSAAELEQEPMREQLFKPFGFGWSVASVVQVPSGDSLIFSIERHLKDGPFAQEVVAPLNELRPHLSRAALISARLQLKRAAGMTESLSAMGLPAAVLLPNGTLSSANSEFETIGPQIASRAFGKIVFADYRANLRLNDAMEQMTSSRTSAPAISIAVPAQNERPPFVAHLLPVTRSAHDIFGPALTVLVVAPLGSPNAPAEDVLSGLFDLSPAESRVAGGLIAGQNVAGLAEIFNVSPLTIRTQVRAVLAKTGTSRQAELVALFAGTFRTSSSF